MTLNERARHEAYLIGLFWILRERAPKGGWPPRDITKVSGWTVVRMLAQIAGRSVTDVASDVIKHAQIMEDHHESRTETAGESSEYRLDDQ
jgi:hypothetical protein